MRFFCSSMGWLRREWLSLLLVWKRHSAGKNTEPRLYSSLSCDEAFRYSFLEGNRFS